MARANQTFKKRQRENKLREKAQMKRDKRLQRQADRKASQAADAQAGLGGFFPNLAEAPESDEVAVEHSEKRL